MSTISKPQKTGVALGALLSLISVPGVLAPTPEGETGPPFTILVVGTALGLIGLVAAAMAWRGGRGAMRVLAGAIIISSLTAVPAFFVDVPALVKLAVGISVLVSVVAVILMFAPSGRPVPQASS